MWMTNFNAYQNIFIGSEKKGDAVTAGGAVGAGDAVAARNTLFTRDTLDTRGDKGCKYSCNYDGRSLHISMYYQRKKYSVQLSASVSLLPKSFS